MKQPINAWLVELAALAVNKLTIVVTVMTLETSSLMDLGTVSASLPIIYQ